MKRLSALILAALMIAVLFAGCGGSGNTTTTAGTTAATTAGTTAATTTATTTTEAAEPGYGGVMPEDQIEYLNYDGPVPLVKDGYDITLSAGVQVELGFPCDVEENWLWDYCKGDLNVTIDADQIMDTEKLNLLLASNMVPDILMGTGFSTSDMVRYGSQEHLLLSLTPYLENYMPSLKAVFDADPNCAPNYTVNAEGDIYAQPRLLDDTTVTGWYIHYGWYDALGLVDAYSDTPWEGLPTSVAELTEDLIMFRDTDPATFGVEQIIPISGIYSEDWGGPMGILAESFGYLMRPYFRNWTIAAGYYPCLRIDDDGTEDYGLGVMDDVFGDFMAVSNDWYNENLYPVDYFTADAAQHSAWNSAGYFGVEASGEGSYMAPDTPGSIPGNENKVMWSLTSSVRQTQPATANYPVYGTSSFYIGGQTEYPELCVRFFDLYWHPEYAHVMKGNPIEGVNNLYGYHGLIWGDDPSNDEQNIHTEGLYTSAGGNTNDYRNAELVPTYMDQCAMNYQYSTNMAKIGAEANGIDLSTLNFYDNAYESVMAGTKNAYELDPVIEKDPKWTDWNFMMRTRYSEMGVEQPLRYVYRDQATTDKIADVQAVVKPYIMEQVALFITGRRPLDEVQTFQGELESMSIMTYDDILSNEYAIYKANMEAMSGN